VPEKENKSLSNYMQFVMGINVPSDKEEREDWSVTKEEVRRSINDLIAKNKRMVCDCLCNRDFFSHLIDLEENPEFRNHFLLMVHLLHKYPELASSFINAACIELAETDWPTIEDNAAQRRNFKQISLEELLAKINNPIL